MGSQSQAQAPQQAHARPMANHAQSSTGTANGNALVSGGGGGGGGSISRVQSLARQGSIYSVTLDDLQRSLMEPGGVGQVFGSMNMDEFLKNIWTMEESQAMASAMSLGSGEGDGGGPGEPGSNHIASENGLVRQPSLARQGSLTLPRQMSRKTVDEVWRDIIKTNPSLAPDEGADAGTGSGPGMKSSDSKRQTYGEMTLEAFLVKAGVVKDGGLLAQPSTPYTLFAPYAGSNGAGAPSDRGNDRGERMGPGSLAATLSLSTANGLGSANDGIAQQQAKQQAQVQAQQQAKQQAQVQAQQQAQGQVDWLRNIQQQQAQQQQQQQQLFQAQADAYAMKARANGGMQPIMSSNGAYSGMVSALAPGLGQMSMQMGGPMALALAPNSPGAHSPVSDEVVHSRRNGLRLSPVGNFGIDGSMRGRKRGADGPVEKVVERRQRRMIKNRESAARSRARKQAYTVELEAEVTQLKEENNRLKIQREDEAHKYKKLVLSSINARKTSKSVSKRLRRTSSGPW